MQEEGWRDRPMHAAALSKAGQGNAWRGSTCVRGLAHGVPADAQLRYCYFFSGGGGLGGGAGLGTCGGGGLDVSKYDRREGLGSLLFTGGRWFALSMRSASKTLSISSAKKGVVHTQFQFSMKVRGVKFWPRVPLFGSFWEQGAALRAARPPFPLQCALSVRTVAPYQRRTFL